MKIKTLFLFFVAIVLLSITASAHPGSWDENGGHYNRSTGEYHFHHGKPEHQHPNNTCEYNFEWETDTSTGSSSSYSSSRKYTASDVASIWDASNTPATAPIINEPPAQANDEGKNVVIVFGLLAITILGCLLVYAIKHDILFAWNFLISLIISVIYFICNPSEEDILLRFFNSVGVAFFSYFIIAVVLALITNICEFIKFLFKTAVTNVKKIKTFFGSNNESKTNAVAQEPPAQPIIHTINQKNLSSILDKHKALDSELFILQTTLAKLSEINIADELESGNMSKQTAKSFVDEKNALQSRIDEIEEEFNHTVEPHAELVAEIKREANAAPPEPPAPPIVYTENQKLLSIISDKLEALRTEYFNQQTKLKNISEINIAADFESGKISKLRAKELIHRRNSLKAEINEIEQEFNNTEQLRLELIAEIEREANVAPQKPPATVVEVVETVAPPMQYEGKPVKARHCKHCGGLLPQDSGKCFDCGKNNFRFIPPKLTTSSVLAVVLAIGLALVCIASYYQSVEIAELNNTVKKDAQIIAENSNKIAQLRADTERFNIKAFLLEKENDNLRSEISFLLYQIMYDL